MDSALRSSLRTVGILGGSFDPVHNAHLALAKAFARTLALDEVRFVPAGRPWQKGGLSASAKQRVAMLELALNELPVEACSFRVDERELRREGATYSIDTLAEMRAEVGPDASLILLIGADQLVRLDTWKRWSELWDYAHVAAATRPAAVALALPPAVEQEWARRLVGPGDRALLQTTQSGHAYLLDGFALDISATRIRTWLAAGGSWPDGCAAFLPRAVLEYIGAHGLYRSTGRTHPQPGPLPEGRE